MMRLFDNIARCSKFYRGFVNDVKSNCKDPASSIALNIIGSGAPGESASVSLSVSNADKYLFNCGEDCVRQFSDQQRKLSRLKHIFVTQNNWNCIGGISNVSNIIKKTQGWLPLFHGPKQLYKCLKRVLCLSVMSELDFKPIHCNLKHFYEDDTLRVDFISTKTNTTNGNDCHLGRDLYDVFTFVGEIKSNSKMNSQAPTRFMSTIVLHMMFILENNSIID